MSEKKWVSAAVIVVIISIFIGTGISNSTLLDSFSLQETTEQVSIEESPWDKEGNTYTTFVEYEAPGGLVTHTFTANIEDDVLTDFEMTIDIEDAVGVALQEAFIEEIDALVIGKKISELGYIDIVAGASLTTDSFNKAISELPV